MFSILNQELEKLPESENRIIVCDVCGKNHVIDYVIDYGEIMLKDSSKIPSKIIGTVSCSNGKTYLAEIMGKRINYG